MSPLHGKGPLGQVWGYSPDPTGSSLDLILLCVGMHPGRVPQESLDIILALLIGMLAGVTL